jgi:hypothetical protein
MEVNQTFENYQNFINEIPDDYSGDELEDFMEEPPDNENNVQKIDRKSTRLNSSHARSQGLSRMPSSA